MFVKYAAAAAAKQEENLLKSVPPNPLGGMEEEKGEEEEKRWDFNLAKRFVGGIQWCFEPEPEKKEGRESA